MRVIAGVTICIALAGCSMAGPQASADELLKQAVSGLSGTDDFQFSGKASVAVGELPLQEGAAFQGVVQGHNRLSMSFVPGSSPGSLEARQSTNKKNPVVFSRKQTGWVLADSGTKPTGDAVLLMNWSPLYKLEQLNSMKKQVEGSRDETEGRLTIVTAIPEQADATEAVKREWARQAEQLDTDVKLADLKSRVGLTDAQAERLRAELDASITSAKRRLNEAASKLEAESTYRIWVDRVSRLPQKMQIVTVMRYMSDGEMKKETNRIDYSFSGFNGQSSSGKSAVNGTVP